MKTPREKYMNDPEYNHLVHTLESMIEQARFTPSELREACVLASINYEVRHIREQYHIREHYIDPRVEDAFFTLDQWARNSQR